MPAAAVNILTTDMIVTPFDTLTVAGYLAAVHATTARRAAVRALRSPMPLLAFVAIAGAWFFGLAQRAPHVWQFFVEYEFLERVATDTHCRNPGWRGLVDAYAAPLLVGTVPWLPLALWSAWKRRRIAQVPSRSQVLERQGAMLIYLWLGLPLCVFLASQSRLPL